MCNQDILKTIELIRESFIGADKVYKQGSCIRFALILQHLYPSGEILYDSDHAIFSYNGEYFDIDGYAVRKVNYIPIMDYGILTVEELLRLRYCISVSEE